MEHICFFILLILHLGSFPSRHTAGVHPCSKAGCEADEECQVDEKGMPQCLCVGPCPPIHRPVCGSDEMTYSSTCELQRQSCLKKRNITLLYEGVCGKFTPVTHSPGVAHLYFSLFCGLFQFCFKDNWDFKALTYLRTLTVLSYTTTLYRKFRLKKWEKWTVLLLFVKRLNLHS